VKPVKVVTGRAVPLRRSDVDTDQIIPSDWLKRVERTGYGEGLFGEWRESSDFVLNQERYRGATVLVAGQNFGTGSSREHAGWALEDYGFQAVISPRFGDIFRNNCGKLGLLTVTLPHELVDRIMDAIDDDPSIEIVIDVEERRVAVPALGIDEPFPLDDFTRYRLVNGYDDIGLTLRHEDAIDTYESRRPSWAPSVSARPGG
jgi:3-isopropylmalate/(R)-2-methylmalate dehydratase small subunit